VEICVISWLAKQLPFSQLTHPDIIEATLTPIITNNAIISVSTPAFMHISRIANAAAKSVIAQNAKATTSQYL